MPLRWFAKKWWLTLGAVFFVALVAAMFVWRWPTSTSTTVNTTTQRQRYADLYQAAWRQDDGSSPTLMTATLLVPPTVEALGQDSGRSSTEEDIWQNVKTITAQHVPIILTIDSVTGPVADDDIKASLALSSDAGRTFTLTNWQPLIAPSRVVNTSGSVSSQIGIAVWKSDTTVDWNTLSTLRLTVKNIGGQSSRTFTWTEPRLLLQVQ